ncbi:ornithine carbamoyltransferase [Bacterioplanes sanyensis]|uniref:Ornithine carbamoyltransferase n=1 Tax=Bacterioplanes sanyensis TaxID=1249553 RepID=A0A222FP45_9GAMM|nr:ornithine carbamoyltransferase [Bacterioplanes sanyensis]ASP40549.1 ornithine carbamoyltransferase [Bacterioplanes sanyensis]
MRDQRPSTPLRWCILKEVSNVRHFLTLLDLTSDELNWVIERATELKRFQQRQQLHEPLKNRVLGMIFEKSSTRTRVSFEAGMAQLGGSAIFLSPRDTQLGRGEPIEDSARVLSRMVDVIMIRTFDHDTVERFSAFSQVPVINALTDDFHPCQLLADMQTYREHRGSIQGKTVAWIGDGNNMCHSYINAARQFDFQLRIATPEGFEPSTHLLDSNRDRVQLLRSPEQAVQGADMVTTDVWASMGQEDEQQQRQQQFADYQVSEALLDEANDDVIFMHCLPAHRGEEISHTLLDDRRSVVWDQAENRLHAQKALLEFLLSQED